MFNFFLNSHRNGILTFSGTNDFSVEYKQDGYDSRLCFRKFDNGDYQNKVVHTKHPNILFSVIKGKKSWGLFVNEWSDGIVESSFTIDEIKTVFDEQNIKVPDPLWKDFLNTIGRKKRIRNQKYYNELIKNSIISNT